MGVLYAFMHAHNASSSFKHQSLMLEFTVFFKNFLYLPVGNFSLPICLRMISQTHYVFYSIPVHAFLKHLVCKMAPSITNNSPGCPKSAQDISL